MSTSSWYLKKPDGSIYGPVHLADLKQWAKDSRVAPEDKLSHDQKDWMPAPELAALDMNCLVRYRHGVDYGPLHLRALCELIIDGDVALDEPVLDKKSSKTLPACVVALRGLMAEGPETPVTAIPRTPSEEARQLHAEHQTALDEVNEKLLGVLQEKKGLETEVRRLDELGQELEKKNADLSRELDELRTSMDSGSAEGQAERGRLQAALDEARQQLEKDKAELAATEKDLTSDRVSLVQEKNAAQKELAELKERIDKAERQAATAVEQQKMLQKKLDAKQEDVEKVVESRTATLKKQLEEEKAGREQAEMAVEARIREAVESETAEYKQRLDHMREQHRKRESNLQQRVAQFEGDLKSKVEDMVRAKQEAEGAKQAAMAQSSGKGPNPVVRAAMSRMNAQALGRGADMHAPRSHAQRALRMRRSEMDAPPPAARRRD